MKNALFWGLFPLVLPQALYVRMTAPRFVAPACATEGSTGTGREFRLLAIGDSIIAGVGATQISRALAGRTAVELANSLRGRVNWVARGAAGYNSSRVVDDLLPKLPPEPVDYIVISVGVNDITGLTTIRTWRRNLRTILTALSRHSPCAAIAFAGIPPLRCFPLLPQPLRAVIGLRGSTFDTEAQRVIEEFPACRHIHLDFEPRPDQFAADGYHPSEESYQHLGLVVADALLSQR